MLTPEQTIDNLKTTNRRLANLYGSAISTLVAFYSECPDYMQKMVIEEVEKFCSVVGISYEIREDGTMDLLTPFEVSQRQAG